MAGVGVLCSKLNLIPYNFYKRGLKILNSKFQILIFGSTYSPLKFDGGECGEYGWVLWASWPRREPRYAGNRHWPVTVHWPSLKTSQRGKCSVEPSSVFQLLSPGKVPKNPLETRPEATPVKSQRRVRKFHYNSILGILTWYTWLGYPSSPTDRDLSLRLKQGRDGAEITSPGRQFQSFTAR